MKRFLMLLLCAAMLVSSACAEALPGTSPAPAADETVLMTEEAPAPALQTEAKSVPIVCGNCGAALAIGVKFCSKCGTKVNAE